MPHRVRKTFPVHYPRAQALDRNYGNPARWKHADHPPRLLDGITLGPLTSPSAFSTQAPLMVLPMYHIGMHQVAPESPIHKRGRGKLSKMFPNVGEVRVNRAGGCHSLCCFM